jgi:hypothetical protein
MMRSVDRVRGVIKGKRADHLRTQAVAMMFGAKRAGIRYTRTRGTLDFQMRIWDTIDRSNVAETRSAFQRKGEPNGV